MSEARFVAGGRRTRVSLPFDLDRAVEGWAGLRTRMIREKPELFTRDEWAYLVSFLEAVNLESAFLGSFGERERGEGGPVDAVARPGGPIAVWLPNNVSLLGALALVLLSLTGNPMWLKAGSRGEDLTREFLGYALERLPAGELKDHLSSSVRAESFSRSDPRNALWAASARTRLAFGTDESTAAVEALPHPAGSRGFSFGHRESEAWIEEKSADEETLTTLLRVFSVYGQAACTSPARVVVLDSGPDSARDLCGRLSALWPRVFPKDPEMAVASTAVLDRQWAASQGWPSVLAPRHGAAFAAGSDGMPTPRGLRLLPIVALPTERALATLPAKIQTIGHAVTPARLEALARPVAGSAAKRFVPVADMHRFGPVWDGEAYWKGTFEIAEATR